MPKEYSRQPPPPPPVDPEIIAAPAPLVVKVRPAYRSNYSAAQRLSPQLIVLHATDGHEGPGKARDVAEMFAGALEKPRASHYVVDPTEAFRCVPDLMTAWHCGHTGNALAIGIEICGRANQSRAQWLDKDSLATLRIAARLCADLCKAHGILPRVVNDRGLLAGQSGITTHAFVSQAWHESDHTDPGAGFPLGSFVSSVARAMV